MRTQVLKTSLALALAMPWAMGAHAQTAPRNAQKTVLPVWNSSNGKLEAYLVLEPDKTTQAGIRWPFERNKLDSVFGLGSGDSLGLRCDPKAGFAKAIDNLAGNCEVYALGDDSGNRRASAGAGFAKGDSRFALTAGGSRESLPTWLMPGSGNNKVNINDLTISAQKSLPRQGFVSIAGTVAKAELLTPEAAKASGLASDRWNSKSLTLGGGVGAFGANLVGQVIDTPGQPKWEGLGVGVTWRTPWSGQLSVGADNVVTRGKNPFAPPNASGQGEEGTVPYVKYEQDL